MCSFCLLCCIAVGNILLSLTAISFHFKASSYTFGSGSEGPIFLDDVQCTGSERTLLACSSSPIETHNCGHYEDAGVQCSTGIHNSSNGDTHIKYIWYLKTVSPVDTIPMSSTYTASHTMTLSPSSSSINPPSKSSITITTSSGDE